MRILLPQLAATQRRWRPFFSRTVKQRSADGKGTATAVLVALVISVGTAVAQQPPGTSPDDQARQAPKPAPELDNQRSGGRALSPPEQAPYDENLVIIVPRSNVLVIPRDNT